MGVKKSSTYFLYLAGKVQLAERPLEFLENFSSHKIYEVQERFYPFS